MRLLDAVQPIILFCCALALGNISSPVDLLLIAALALALVLARHIGSLRFRTTPASPSSWPSTQLENLEFLAPTDPEVPGNARSRAPSQSFAAA